MTATKLREDFLNFVCETRKTSLFIIHDIDEAIELGSRALVLGKPKHLLIDIDTSRETKVTKQSAGVEAADPEDSRSKPSGGLMMILP